MRGWRYLDTPEARARRASEAAKKGARDRRQATGFGVFRRRAIAKAHGSKLDPYKVRDMRHDHYCRGFSAAYLAARQGVSERYARKVICGETWSCLPMPNGIQGGSATP